MKSRASVLLWLGAALALVAVLLVAETPQDSQASSVLRLKKLQVQAQAQTSAHFGQRRAVANSASSDDDEEGSSDDEEGSSDDEEGSSDDEEGSSDDDSEGGSEDGESSGDEDSEDSDSDKSRSSGHAEHFSHHHGGNHWKVHNVNKLIVEHHHHRGSSSSSSTSSTGMSSAEEDSDEESGDEDSEEDSDEESGNETESSSEESSRAGGNEEASEEGESSEESGAKEKCVVASVTSIGFNRRYSWDIEVDGFHANGQHKWSRGLNVLVLDPKSLDIVKGFPKRFDTNGDKNAAANLVRVLRGLPKGSPVLIACHDDCSRRMTEQLTTLMYNMLRLKQLSKVGFRHSYAAIGLKGQDAIDEQSPGSNTRALARGKICVQVPEGSDDSSS